MKIEGINNHPLATLWDKRYRAGRDLKTLINAKQSQTGVGKTSLLAGLCKWADKTHKGWSYLKATHYATGRPGIYDCAPDAMGYADMYEVYPDGSSLAWTEMGVDAGHRTRGMANKTKQVADAWQLYRNSCMFSVGDLPSTADLYSRLLRYTDIVITIEEVGFRDYRGTVSRVMERRTPNGDVETWLYHYPAYLRWQPMDSDKDYQMLEKMKSEFRRRIVKDEPVERAGEELRKEKEKLKIQERNIEIYKQYHVNELTQKEIAERYDLTQQRIGQIIRELGKNKPKATI